MVPAQIATSDRMSSFSGESKLEFPAARTLNPSRHYAPSQGQAKKCDDEVLPVDTLPKRTNVFTFCMLLMCA